MASRSERTIPSWLALLLLVGLAIALHARLLGCTFFSDDFSVLQRLRTGGASSFFRPLADGSLWLNYRIAGPSPWAFRIVNVALLGVNGALVFLLGRRLADAPAALHAGALFVLYPFHIEPQAWIIGRGIAMASAFTLGALVVAAGNAPTAKRTVAVAVLVLLGSLCYESALLAPLLLGAWGLILRPADAKAWRAAVAASVAVVALNLALRGLVLGGITNDYGAAFFSKPLSGLLGSAMKAVGRSFLPPHADAGAQAIRFGLLGAALAVAGALAWRALRGEGQRRRQAALLVALFAIAAIPAAVGGVSTRTGESDRFLYLPSAFVCLLVALLIDRVRPGGVKRAAAVLVAASWALLLFQGQRDWRKASDAIARILAATPDPPSGGRLLVLNLPGDHQGAYIFRHGFREALELAGRDASRVVVVRERLDHGFVTDAGDTLAPQAGDAWFKATVRLP